MMPLKEKSWLFTAVCLAALVVLCPASLHAVSPTTPTLQSEPPASKADMATTPPVKRITAMEAARETTPTMAISRQTVHETTPTLVVAGPGSVEAFKSGGFSTLTGVAPARYPTRVSAWYDPNELWIIIEAHGKNRHQLKADHTARDSDVWQDDAVEVFIAPHESIYRYWHVIVNPAGGILDEWVDKHGPQRSHDLEGLRVSILYGYDWWRAYFAIPFDSLGVDVPEKGESWRFNATRFVPEPDGGEASSWAPMPTRTFHYPANFGFLEFQGGEYQIELDDQAGSAEPPE